MRLLLLTVLVVFFLVHVEAGGQQRFFGGPSPLPKVTLPAQHKSLPEQTLPPKYLKEVTERKFIDQDIIQPKLIKQPIIQQRLVEQPIIRTRIVHQPLIRRVTHKSVVRPHVIAKEELRPVYQKQDVLVPKYIDKTVVKEEYQKQHSTRPTETMQATFQGKSRQQLYGNPRMRFAAADPPADPAAEERGGEAFAAEPAAEEMLPITELPQEPVEPAAEAEAEAEPIQL